MNQLENKPELTLRIQNLKDTIQYLEELARQSEVEKKQESKVFFKLLRAITLVFEEVEQRLTEVKKEQEFK